MLINEHMLLYVHTNRHTLHAYVHVYTVHVTHVHRILVFGRLCRGLTECCPSLYELLSGLDGGSDGASSVGVRFRPRLFSAKEKEVCTVCSGKDVET